MVFVGRLIGLMLCTGRSSALNGVRTEWMDKKVFFDEKWDQRGRMMRSLLRKRKQRL